MEIVVKYSGQERSFLFTRHNTNNYDIAERDGILLSDICERLVWHFSLKDDMAVVLLYNGHFYLDGSQRIKLLSPTSTMYLLQVPLDTAIHLHVDQPSVTHAIEWMSSSCDLQDPKMKDSAQLTMLLSTCAPTTETNNTRDSALGNVNSPDQTDAAVANGGAAAVDNNPVVAAINNEPHFLMRWIRVSLIIRLALFYFVFYHEREESMEKKAAIIGKSYILQTTTLTLSFR